MAERAAAEHGDAQAGRCGDGRDEEGCLVADAAGGVLVDRGTRWAAVCGTAQIELHAGGAHGLGERLNLRWLHAAQEGGHEKGAELRVVDGVVGGTARDVRDLGSGEGVAIALAADDAAGVERGGRFVSVIRHV